jgi:hypothetical protein
MKAGNRARAGPTAGVVRGADSVWSGIDSCEFYAIDDLRSLLTGQQPKDIMITSDYLGALAQNVGLFDARTVRSVLSGSTRLRFRD